eukprot:2179152-Pyramimonas_sp.AAC.3
MPVNRKAGDRHNCTTGLQVPCWLAHHNLSRSSTRQGMGPVLMGGSHRRGEKTEPVCRGSEGEAPVSCPGRLLADCLLRSDDLSLNKNMTQVLSSCFVTGNLTEEIFADDCCYGASIIGSDTPINFLVVLSPSGALPTYCTYYYTCTIYTMSSAMTPSVAH